MFPPSNDFDFIDFAAPIIGDDIHESTEGFFARILFAFEVDADRVLFENEIERDGFSLIRIVNDDCES